MKRRIQANNDMTIQIVTTRAAFVRLNGKYEIIFYKLLFIIAVRFSVPHVGSGTSLTFDNTNWSEWWQQIMAFKWYQFFCSPIFCSLYSFGSASSEFLLLFCSAYKPTRLIEMRVHSNEIISIIYGASDLILTLCLLCRWTDRQFNGTRPHERTTTFTRPMITHMNVDVLVGIACSHLFRYNRVTGVCSMASTTVLTNQHRNM